jgi:hypothetical protein
MRYHHIATGRQGMGLVSNQNVYVLTLLEDWIGCCVLGGLVFLLQLLTYLNCSHLQVLHLQISMLLSTIKPKKCTKDRSYLHQVLPRIILVEDINAKVF